MKNIFHKILTVAGQITITIKDKKARRKLKLRKSGHGFTHKEEG